MKVKCPSCGTQYNLDPTKIADAGIKVRCPSCAHVFVVRKKAAEREPAQPQQSPAAITTRTAARMGSEDEPIALDAGASDHFHGGPEDEAEAAPVGVPSDVGQFFDKPAQSVTAKPAPKPVAPPPPPVAPKPAAKPAPVVAEAEAGGFTGEGEWRVKKSGLGLVYGPADIGTIQAWLKAERVGSQDLYSLNGGDWIPPGNFKVIAELLKIPYAGPPQPEAVAKAAAAHAERTTAAAAAPSPRPQGDAPVQGKAKRAPAPEPMGFELPDDDFDMPTGMGTGATVAIAAVLVLIAGLAGLYFGVVKNPAMLAKMPSAIRPTLEKMAGGGDGEKQAPKKASAANRDPIKALAARLPEENLRRVRSLIATLSLDTPAGYAAAITDVEALIEDVPAEAVPLRALQGVVLGLSVFRKASEGDFTELRGKAEAILVASPGDPIAHDALAIALLGTGKLAEAAAEASLAIEKNPDDFFAYYIRALAMPPGEADLENSKRVRDTFNPVLVQLARADIDGGKLEEARTLLESVLSRAGEHAEARQLLDEIVLPGLQSGGVVPAEKTGNLAAETVVGRTQVEDRRTREELLEAAKTAFKDGNYEEAEKLYIRLFDNHYEEIGLRNVALIHFYLGEIYRLSERFERARAQYEAALAVAPKFAQASQRLSALPDPVPEDPLASTESAPSGTPAGGHAPLE